MGVVIKAIWFDLIKETLVKGSIMKNGHTGNFTSKPWSFVVNLTSTHLLMQARSQIFRSKIACIICLIAAPRTGNLQIYFFFQFMMQPKLHILFGKELYNIMEETVLTCEIVKVWWLHCCHRSYVSRESTRSNGVEKYHLPVGNNATPDRRWWG